MRNEITVKIDTCEKCPNFVKTLAWDVPMCGINRFYIEIISTGHGIDIPLWCPILMQSQWINKFLSAGDRGITNQLVEMLRSEEKASSEQQNEEARNIELD